MIVTFTGRHLGVPMGCPDEAGFILNSAEQAD